MGILGKIWDVATDVGHAVTGIPTAEQKRNTQKMMNDQINLYKQQTQLAESQMKEARDAKLREKKKIEEKQIRQLRRSNRSPGFLDQGQDGLSNTLGA